MTPWCLCVLVVSLVLASDARGAPPGNLKFSHRFHLVQVRAKCTDCHVAAESSTAATDSLLPKEKTCLTCHDSRQARKDCTVCHDNPKQARAFAPAARTFRFSHKQHLAFGDLGPILAGAIRNKQYFSQPPPAPADLATKNACAACHRGLARTDFATHANLPQMADCISCHTRIDPPFSCGFCHTREAVLKPASHTPDYQDLHSSKKLKLDKPSCAICHGVNFRCLGCH
jgi:c(7)-type cytochrome triheme protein